MKHHFTYALRLFAMRPWYTFFTLVVLFLGITTPLITYSLINVMMFKELPLPQADRLALVSLLDDAMEGRGLTPHNVQYIQEQQAVFDKLGMFRLKEISIVSNKEPHGILGAYVGPDYFNVLEVPAFKGRLLNQQDTLPDSPIVAVISYPFWQKTFLGKSDVLGERIRVGGKDAEIVGVMPEGHGFPILNDIWVPLQLDYSQLEREFWGDYTLVGRLKQGVSLDEANKHLVDLTHQMVEQSPEFNEGKLIYAYTVQSYFIGDKRAQFRMMQLLVFLVLFIACANLSGLLLARMEERKQEIAIRMALGANRKQIVGQILFESSIICTVGGIFSLLFAAWFLELMNDMIRSSETIFPFWMQLGLDPETLGMALGIVLFTTVASALFPAIKASSIQFNEVLKSGTRGAQSRRSGKLLQGLVAIEIALSSGLILVSTLMMLNSYFSAKTDYGMSTDSILVANFAEPRYFFEDTTNGKREQFLNSVRQALENQSGIQGVTFASSIPGDELSQAPFHEPGEVHEEINQYRTSFLVTTDNFYFQTLGIPLKAGRLPNALDDHSEFNKVVVTESFAKEWWPGENPLGKRFALGVPQEKAKWDLEVVGVVPHVVTGEPGENDVTQGSVFLNYNQAYFPTKWIMVKVQGDPNSYQNMIKDILFKINPDVSIFEMDSLHQRIEQNKNSLLRSLFFFFIYGLAALTLALTGIYGVMSLSVQQKTQEIGIRRALGGTHRTVFWWLVREGTLPLIVGLVVGMSIGAGIVFSTFHQFQMVTTLIPFVFILILLFVTVVMGLAIGLPAQKALNEEPIYALRVE